jgi:hypothetical protein
MLNPAWPKRIDCGRQEDQLKIAGNRVFSGLESDPVFGQARTVLKMLPVGVLHA